MLASEALGSFRGQCGSLSHRLSTSKIFTMLRSSADQAEAVCAGELVINAEESSVASPSADPIDLALSV